MQNLSEKKTKGKKITKAFNTKIKTKSKTGKKWIDVKHAKSEYKNKIKKRS